MHLVPLWSIVIYPGLLLILVNCIFSLSLPSLARGVLSLSIIFSLGSGVLKPIRLFLSIFQDFLYLIFLLHITNAQVVVTPSLGIGKIYPLGIPRVEIAFWFYALMTLISSIGSWWFFLCHLNQDKLCFYGLIKKSHGRKVLALNFCIIL